MNLERFQTEREPRWRELERLLEDARGRSERLGPDGVRRLGERYRAASADLALARRSFAGDPLVARLEDLVGRTRPLVYDAPGERGSLRSFASRGYWRRIAERPQPVLVAWALLIGAGLLGLLWSRHDPEAAIGVVPAAFRGGMRHSNDLGLSPGEQSAFSTEIFTNNIKVSFLAFAGGLAAGLPTGAALLYNGLLLGVLGGLADHAGSGETFFELVFPHGVLELSCIAVSGAAGLRVGWALVEPGRRRRAVALQAEARRAVEVVLGTIPWLVLAGLVEGFLTPRGLGLGAVLSIGLGLGVLFWG
ncbi:MAG: stage II sporulation protein M, partial [Actinomycetota bacterium]|nr:stage II sporulation protein M [Actinomycetota bacterium]